jgi:chaperone required for assembly of F1-ATPase
MSDLLCYRAENPDPLIAKQASAWDPVLAWAKRQFGLVLHTTDSVLPISQPAETEEKLRHLGGEDAFRLTGLAHLAALLGSAVLALALEQGEISPEQAYELAFLDDLFQIETWGSDEEAQVRLDNIALEIKAVARYLSALQQ